MNPWLEIPLADYEGHMAMPAIGQASMLADQLVALVARFHPSEVAVIGCAGGNGFDRLGTLDRLVGVDINPRYIDLAASRHAGKVAGLELYVGDIQIERQMFRPVDLIYAALVFEYVDVAQSLRNLARHCKPGGVLVALLQLPHESKRAITPSPFTSLQRLLPSMKLVNPHELIASGAAAGLELSDSSEIASGGDKRFAVLVFRGGRSDDSG